MCQTRVSEAHPSLLLGKGHEKPEKETGGKVGSRTLGQAALGQRERGCKLLEGEHQT